MLAFSAKKYSLPIIKDKKYVLASKSDEIELHVKQSFIYISEDNKRKFFDVDDQGQPLQVCAAE